MYGTMYPEELWGALVLVVDVQLQVAEQLLETAAIIAATAAPYTSTWARLCCTLVTSRQRLPRQHPGLQQLKVFAADNVQLMV